MNNIIQAIYDDAHAFSLRNRDEKPELIENVGHVIRMRLNCRAAENLVLTDDALSLVGTTWNEMKAKIEAWVAANPDHLYSNDMRRFVDSGFDRQSFGLKAIRNILIGLISNKPWEVLVGQSIAALVTNNLRSAGEGSLQGFLGEKVCAELLKLPRRQIGDARP